MYKAFRKKASSMSEKKISFCSKRSTARRRRGRDRLVWCRGGAAAEGGGIYDINRKRKRSQAIRGGRQNNELVGGEGTEKKTPNLRGVVYVEKFRQRGKGRYWLGRATSQLFGTEKMKKEKDQACGGPILLSQWGNEGPGSMGG